MIIGRQLHKQRVEHSQKSCASRQLEIARAWWCEPLIESSVSSLLSSEVPAFSSFCLYSTQLMELNVKFWLCFSLPCLSPRCRKECTIGDRRRWCQCVIPIISQRLFIRFGDRFLSIWWISIDVSASYQAQKDSPFAGSARLQFSIIFSGSFFNEMNDAEKKHEKRRY